MKKYTADQSDTGKRLDTFVAEKYPKFSRSSLKNLFAGGQISLNNRSAKPSVRVKIDDIVGVESEVLDKQPDKINMPIVFENKDVIVVDKPAGVLTHSKGALNLEPTVASFIKPKISDKNLTGNRAGIVHRLDRLTSGLLIAAKNQKSLADLQKQFSLRKVEKNYIAIVPGKMKQKEALIDMPIMRDPKHPKQFIAHQNGKIAQTEYRVIKEFSRGGEQYSLLEIKPLTGRTHQIRVHMAEIGHPVVGDLLYGKPYNTGMMLHALKLTINIKDEGRKTFELTMPTRLQNFINNAK